MNTPITHITGMPYFPGVATGLLHRGPDAATAHSILMVTQQEVSCLDELAAGFIVVEAAPFSHPMIKLLNIGRPTVLISAEQAVRLENGVELLIDGNIGLITDQMDASPAQEENIQTPRAGQPVLMADGEPVNLCASVRHRDAAQKAVVFGAKAIGLVRTEFLSPDNDQQPDAVFYRQCFRGLCEAAAGLSVSFRLLDVAADKIPSWLPALEGIGQPLGLNGVRLYDSEPVTSVVNAQLSAISDMSSEFNLRLLLPFITRPEEYSYWLAKVRRYLPDHIPVGAMVETPASVLDIDQLLRYADFVAIGCNDLMQGLFVADRDLPVLHQYLDPYAPVLYRLLRQVADQADSNLADVQVCGLLSQIQGVLPVLLGLGYRTFSVDAAFIPHLSNLVTKTNQNECESIAQRVCAAPTSCAVLDVLKLTKC